VPQGEKIPAASLFFGAAGTLIKMLKKKEETFSQKVPQAPLFFCFAGIFCFTGTKKSKTFGIIFDTAGTFIKTLEIFVPQAPLFFIPLGKNHKILGNFCQTLGFKHETFGFKSQNFRTKTYIGVF
jgi:hypothetical protein